MTVNALLRAAGGRRFNFQAVLACSVAVGALLAGSGAAMAADFTVQSGQTVTTTQTLANPGDTGLIKAGGTIETTNVNAVDSLNNDQTVTNQGEITTSDNFANGIYSIGADARIDNSGDISTSGQGARGITSVGVDAQIENSGTIRTLNVGGFGIYSIGADARINNSGDISTSGGSAYSIYSTGPNALIDNSGSITTSGSNGYGIRSTGPNARIDNSGDITTLGGIGLGIYSDGADTRIDNSGDISTSGNTAHGINATGSDARIDNRGNITTSGSNANAILSSGANARITNSGDITTKGNAAFGIAATGQNATVTNSGKITANLNVWAIRISQANGTLNLLAGSAIQGGIQFSDPGTATLNIGPGQNTALTFTGLPGAINSNGAPMAVQGSLVAVVDPTGFSAEDEMLADLTRAIAGAVDGRLNAARFGYVPLNSSVTAYVEPEAPATTFGYGAGSGTSASHASGFWAAGIGSYRNQDADGVDVGFDTALGGLLVGYDAQVSSGTRVGGFLGASTSRFETDANSQEIDADSYYGGVYAGFTDESYFLDLSLTGGVSQQSSDRTVANNLVEGGIEHAEADYDGVFVSPSATIGTTYAMSGGTLIPTFRARYAGLFLDSYDESGSAADLSVDDRDVNVFDFRAQLAYALAAKPVDNGSVHTAFRFGADATFADNDNVEVALLGEALNFSVSGDDTLRGFAGFDVSYSADGGSSYFLGAEAGYDSGDAFTLDVQGGLRIPL
jgi:hypothetical protein